MPPPVAQPFYAHVTFLIPTPPNTFPSATPARDIPEGYTAAPPLPALITPIEQEAQPK